MNEERPHRHPRAREMALPSALLGFASMVSLYALGSVVGTAAAVTEAAVVVREILWFTSILGAGVVMSWFLVVRLRRHTVPQRTR
jgi:cation transporter-like permease